MVFHSYFDGDEDAQLLFRDEAQVLSKSTVTEGSSLIGDIVI